jgi:hypothetical protein
MNAGLESGLNAAVPVALARSESRGSLAARRLLGGLAALGAAAVLGLAAWFTPAEAGLGTHEQLNLPPCNWVTILGLPCPTCGMTTAFAHAANGDFLASFHAQPMGFVLALATAMALIAGAYVAATGSAIGAALRRYVTARAGWVAGAGFGAAWIYKILSFTGVL